MTHNNHAQTDHRHADPADEQHARHAAESLHGKRDVGTGQDSASSSGREAARAASQELDPPGDPDEESREAWERIAQNQPLITPDNSMPSPHLPKG